MRNRKEKTVRHGTVVVALTILAFASISRAESGIKTIDTDTLHSLVSDNIYKREGGKPIRNIVIDTRTPEEFAAGNIITAINVPLDGIEQSLGALPADKSVQLTIYGNESNLDACRKWAAKASTHGYTNIFISTDTYQNWQQNKLPSTRLR